MIIGIGCYLWANKCKTLITTIQNYFNRFAYELSQEITQNLLNTHNYTLVTNLYETISTKVLLG